MVDAQKTTYLRTLVGKVNRDRLIAFFVCAPLALLVMRLSTHDEITGAEALKGVLFAVATYSSGAACVSAWPSKRKQALAGEPPTPTQIWLFRVLSASCAFLALLAALGLFITIHSA